MISFEKIIVPNTIQCIYLDILTLFLYPYHYYWFISIYLQGGPDFYINVQDNSKIHGPGGQSNYPDPSEADICFAKVVNGFNVVDRIHKERVKPGDDYMAIESNVAIVSMKIQNFHDEEKVMK